MLQVSSFHLGSASARSRGIFQPPFTPAPVRAAPERIPGPVCVDPSRFFVILDQPPPRRPKSGVRHGQICHICLPALSPSCLFAPSHLAFLFFSLSHTHLVKQSVPSLPCPPACLVCLSGNCLTRPRLRTNTLNLSKYTQCSW